MVQLSSDYARQKELMQATLSARREGAEFVKSPLYERLADMQAKAERRKRKKSKWFMILVVASVIPFIFGGKADEDSSKAVAKNKTYEMQQKPDLAVSQSPEEEMDKVLAEQEPHEKATVSVTIGGKTVSRELTVAEIKELQKRQND